MTEKDHSLVQNFENEMVAAIDSLPLTEEEISDFNDLLNFTNRPPWEEIEDFSKKIYRRIFS